VLVDDCSTDETLKIAAQAAQYDSRIKVAQNTINSGPSATLNKAARIASSNILFRLDADDIMVAERLERQLLYLQENPETDFLGAYYVNIDEHGRKGKAVKSTIRTGEALRAKFLFTNAMGHSTIVYRRQAFEAVGGYSVNLRSSLDYDFLARLSQRFVGAILPRPLIYYRTHNKNITSNRAKEQIQNAAIIQHRLLREYGFELSEAELQFHSALFLRELNPRSRKEYRDLIWKARNHLVKLRQINMSVGAFDPSQFEHTLSDAHTSLFARSLSPLKIRDYIKLLTSDFSSFKMQNIIPQLAHTVKNGI
jgi:glycosyltransferase involved in cell wall biosynthesis